jgi:hypothetical protein
MLNFIPNVCILLQTVMAGLTKSGAESVAPNAGGVVRVPSTVCVRRADASPWGAVQQRYAEDFSEINLRLSCTFPQHFSTATTIREMATQSRRERSSEVHVH